MEVEPIVIETNTPEEDFSKLCIGLEDVGFVDVHAKALENACNYLKEAIDLDFMKRKSFTKKLVSSRPHLFINAKTQSTVILDEPAEEECLEGTFFEIVCFSKRLDEMESLVQTLKKLLIEKVGVPKAKIHDGNIDDLCNKRFIKSLSETQRSIMVKKVGTDVLDVFKQEKIKDGLKALTTLPFKVFDRFTLHGANPQALVSFGLLRENYSPICKKCGPSSVAIALYDSQESLSSALKRKTLICSKCGSELNPENATIRSHFCFTNLGLECAKGLWLEAYVKSILEELGIFGDRMKLCAVHGKDELDFVFTDCGNLYVCECRDKVVGRNDIYVLAMKVNRIEEDEESEASPNKVLVISTKSISKDIISSERAEEGKPQYVAVCGDMDAIRNNLVKSIRKARRKYKREKTKQLSQILHDCTPLNTEEIIQRAISLEEYPFF